MITGNSQFADSLKHISNHEISAARFSAVVVFCFKSIRSNMQIYSCQNITLPFLVVLVRETINIICLLKRDPSYKESE